MRYLYLLMFFILLFSCSMDPVELEKTGDYDKAIALYKEMLAENYRNEDLRTKFTLCYFKNASKHISKGNLEEAERNIERGIIYTDISHESIRNEYAEIILYLGEELVKIGDPDGTVNEKKQYQKGYNLIKRSVDISDDSTVGLNILTRLNKSQSLKYYEKAQEQFNQFVENTRKKNMLISAYETVENSIEVDSTNSQAITLKNDILEKLLYESINDSEYRFRIMRIFHNSSTGFTAFKIRFYNDTDQDMTVSPEQFTLIDSKGKYYKYDKNAGISGNYIGLMTRRRVYAGRFINGLIVFNSSKKNPVYSSLIWSGNNNSYQKEFPSKKILELVTAE